MANADNDLLNTKPMDFFKRYSVSPPDDAGYGVVDVPGETTLLGQKREIRSRQVLTPSVDIWSDPDNQVLPQTITKIEYQKVIKGRVLWADVIDVERDKPGAKTFKLESSRGDGLVPVYYLPWCSTKLIEMYLQDAGADLDNTDEFPRLFFTAALSGCSVFVDGDPAHPRVVHAGINGVLKDDAATFWRRMLSNVGSRTGVPINDHLMEVNKGQYMDTIWGKAFKEYLQADYRDVLTIKDVKEWGSVFGIRYGRLWSFYVQRNATVTTLRVVKKSDVTKGKDKEMYLGSTGFKVSTEKVKGSGFFSKSKTLYIAKEEFARPVIIEEFYPGRRAIIKPERTLLVS